MQRISTTNTLTLRTRQQGNLACFPNSVSTMHENTLLVYPNPSAGNWTLNIQPITGNVQLKVLDICGRIIYETLSENGSIPINGKTWPNGLYVVQAKQNEKTYRATLVKSE